MKPRGFRSQSSIHRILIVDDDDIDRFKLRKNILAAFPAREISEAFSGADAFHFLARRAENMQPLPDLIFLDLNMPAMTGLGFVELFGIFSKRYKNNCRIIMIHSYEDEKEKNAVLEHDMVEAYLKKPITAEMLLSITKRIILQNAS